MLIDAENLRIVPFSERYIGAELVGWLNDPQLMRYSEQRHKVHDENTCARYANSFAHSPHYYFALESTHPAPAFIGTMTVYQDCHNGVADIGILVGAARGKGYGREAWQAMLGWVQTALQPRKITAGTLSVNHPMLSIMKGSGMQADGLRKDHCVVDGHAVDVVYMAKFC